jgi:hypothetical protein
LFTFTQIYQFYFLFLHKIINFIVYFYTNLSILLFTLTQMYRLIVYFDIFTVDCTDSYSEVLTNMHYFDSIFFYRNVHVHLIFTIWACTCIVFKDSLCMHNHSKTKQILKIIWNLQETIKTWNAKLSINILEANKSAKTKTIFTI